MNNNQFHETTTRRQAVAGRSADEELPLSAPMIDLLPMIKVRNLTTDLSIVLA
jgi:hypothetical protein